MVQAAVLGQTFAYLSGVSADVTQRIDLDTYSTKRIPNI